MDPQGFSDFIAKHGRIVGSKQVKNEDPLGEPGYVYVFEDKAEVTYFPGRTDPATGQVVTRPVFLPDESKIAKPSASANESVSAPANQPNLISRKPDGSLDVQPNPNYAGGDRAAQEQIERQRNSATIGIPFTDIERAQWEANRAKEANADSDQARAEARQARLDAEKSAHDAFSRSITERQVTLQETEAARRANEGNWQPTEVNGRKVLVNTKTGEQKPLDQGTTPGTDFGELQFTVENATRTMLDAFNKANARRIRGEITQEQMNAELKPVFDLGNAEINRANGILQTQRGIFQDESANFRQRTATAQSIISDAFTRGREGGGPAGRLVPSGESVRAQMMLAAQYANMFAPQPTMGAGLQQAKNLTIDLSTGKLEVPIGQAGGQAPDIGNPLALGMAQEGVSQQAKDLTMRQIKDDPFFAPVLSDFAAGPGMSLTDQLRAPGFTAAEEPDTVGVY